MNDRQRGIGLVLALLVLAFLSILGGALLTTTAIDARIGDNYRTAAQLLYLAEAGIEEARESLRVSPIAVSQLLADAAGPDGAFSSSRDLDTILNGSDDVAFVGGGNRWTGRVLTDPSGRSTGHYFVFLRSGAYDDRVLDLLSIAVIGNSARTIEVTVTRQSVPAIPAALTLDGSPAAFNPGDAPFSRIDGVGAHAVGVIVASDQSAILAANPSSPPDVGIVDGQMDPRLRTPAGIERVIDGIRAIATETYDPGWDGATHLANVGNSNALRIAVVNGNCEFGPGTGYGVLVVRGDLILNGNFDWEGPILVVGQGVVRRSGGGSGRISGGLLVARSRASDRSADNTLGTVLAVRGAVNVDLHGGYSETLRDQVNLDAVNQVFPYVPIAYREY